jgi:hypothetical protein
VETPDRTLVAVSAALSAGAGLIHLGLAPGHVDHHWSMGAAFFVVGWAQVAWAVAVWFRAGRRLLAAGIALQGAALAGLFAATSVGWPFGPSAWEREAMSTPAWICAGLELAALAAMTALLVGRLTLPRLALPMALVAVVAASSAALAVDPGHGGADGHHAVAVGVSSAHADSGHVPGDAHAPDAHAADAPASDDDHAEAASHPDGEPHVDAALVDTAAAAAASGGHAHGPVDTTPPTDAQRAAADTLLRETRAALKKYEVLSVAEAEGFKVTHDAGGKLFHYGHPGYRNDGRTLDPNRIESLLYVSIPNGGMLLVGGMYTMPLGEKGPKIGGSLTQWHGHDDLCIDPAKELAISQPPGGGCPPGSTVSPTGEMMHVWSIEYPGGPFGELDAAALREAVLDVYGMGTQPAAT